MSDVRMFWSLCAECVEFLSQRRSRAVLMESTHGEGQTDKQVLCQRKGSGKALTTSTRYVLKDTERRGHRETETQRGGDTDRQGHMETGSQRDGDTEKWGH